MLDPVLLLIYEKIQNVQYLMVVRQKLSSLLINYEVQFDVIHCEVQLLFGHEKPNNLINYYYYN